MDTIPESARSILIAQNPKSGASNRAKLVKQLAVELESAGMSVQILQNIEDLVASTQTLLENGDLRAVVSAGGDGTVSLLVNCLPPQTPFFVFPLGTANLLAKYLQSTTNIAAAVKIIAGGKTTRLDVGKANDQFFLVVASCGYDADVVHRIHATRQGHINYASYFLPVWKSILGYRFPPMNLTMDGEKIPASRWSFVFNVPKYAIGLQFCKTADGQDGLLDVCTFANGGFIRGLGYFFSVLFRKHHLLSASKFFQFKNLEITPASDVPVPVELDGDPAGFLPIKISVVPQRLRVLVDATWTS